MAADVLGVLLAAGTGSRYGDGNKLLRKIDEEPIVRKAAWTLADSPLDEVVAVLGHDGALVAGTLARVPLTTVHNPRYEEGQGTSVARAALAAEDEGAEAALIHLGDMPCVQVSTVRALLEAYEAGEADIVVPVHDGERGNPVIFGESHYDTLQRLEGDDGGRLLFEANTVVRVEVDDPGIHLDVDTEDDLEYVEQLRVAGQLEC